MQPPTDLPVSSSFLPNPANVAPRAPETTNRPGVQSPFTTPPMQTYTPGQHNYSPYPTATSPLRRSLGASDTTSQPTTPVKGLSTVEVKKLGKEINSVAKIVEVVWMAVNAFSENNIQTDQVLDYLKDVIDQGVRNLRVLRVCS